LKTLVEDRPSCFPPVHTRLGLSEEEFETLLTTKIDDFLLAEKEARRRDKELDCDAPSSSTPTPSLPVLTKDEAFCFIEAHGLPKTGPILDVLWWVADIGWTRFNFDFDFDRDDLSILNAYD
jgi:hypothetical protein